MPPKEMVKRTSQVNKAIPKLSTVSKSILATPNYSNLIDAEKTLANETTYNV